eukprot:3380436-Rhodomonas_salina.2
MRSQTFKSSETRAKRNRKTRFTKAQDTTKRRWGSAPEHREVDPVSVCRLTPDVHNQGLDTGTYVSLRFDVRCSSAVFWDARLRLEAEHSSAMFWDAGLRLDV